MTSINQKAVSVVTKDVAKLVYNVIIFFEQEKEEGLRLNRNKAMERVCI